MLPTPKFHFASDNTSGLCPEAWAALQGANEGYCPSYGEDGHTLAASEALREIFATDADIYFVFNGTAANSLALATLCQSYHSILAHQAAHVETDECGAPEFFSNGTKILLLPDRDKVQPGSLTALCRRRADIHFPKPRVFSLSQPSELGLVYTPAELCALTSEAHALGLKVHLDGARFAHAVAALGVSPAEVAWQAGVDVLCFGGTKLGLGLADAVIFFDRDLSTDFAWRCKQAGQLASKMRYLSAPWAEMLREGHWLRYARQANAHAQRLARAAAEIPGVRLAHPCEANAVFLELAPGIEAHLRVQGWVFYAFIGGASRFMCSWKTTADDVDALLSDLCRAASDA